MVCHSLVRWTRHSTSSHAENESRSTQLKYTENYLRLRLNSITTRALFINPSKIMSLQPPKHAPFRSLFLATALLIAARPAVADENLFNYVKGSETLPQGHFEFYQTSGLRTGKDTGSYRGWDLESELEYGFTDKFQASIAAKQHFFDVKGNDELDDGNYYRFAGVEASAKYRFTSVFKDGYGLALRLEGGYLRYDDVAGLPEKEWFIAPTLIFQKNFLDDTLITVVNGGAEWAWGKQPAEEYPKEISLQGGVGVTYRVAPNWFVGIDSRVRSEWPMFDFNNFEHVVAFAGPVIHYSSKNWWATLSWGYQIYGRGVDEIARSHTFAEEVRHEFALKIGFNF